MFGFSKTEKVKDPVCGMKINKETAKSSLEYQGKKYYFCSENCKKQFDAAPQDFIIKEDMSHSCC